MSKKGKLTLVKDGTDKEKALDAALKQIERVCGTNRLDGLGGNDALTAMAMARAFPGRAS